MEARPDSAGVHVNQTVRGAEPVTAAFWKCGEGSPAWEVALTLVPETVPGLGMMVALAKLSLAGAWAKAGAEERSATEAAESRDFMVLGRGRGLGVNVRQKWFGATGRVAGRGRWGMGGKETPGRRG